MTRPSATIRRRLLPIAAAVALLALAASGALPGLLDALAYLLPPLLLLVVLVARRYPGERALLALIAGDRHGRRSTCIGFLIAKRRPRAMVPRGGRLIACSLAVRPPPAPHATPS
jgi:hypothetical protein